MAAVNGIIASALGDLTTTETLNNEFLLLLAERSTLMDHPALFKGDSIDGRGSNVLKVSHVGLMGYDLPAATGDGTAVANSPFTDGSTTVTVTRQSKAYERSDLAGMVSQGKLDASVFALDAAMSCASRLTELLADIIDGFAATAGSTGVDLDVATLLGAAGTARVNNVQGALLCVLHGQQWRDVSIDMATAVGGTTQNSPSADAAATRVFGSGDQGFLFGMDIVTNNRVVTANAAADRAGGVFGRGGVIWTDGTPPLDNPSQQLLIGKTLFELARSATTGETQFVSHCYLGASLGLEAGVSIVTDA